MNDQTERDFEGFERRVREAFDASVEAVDRSTRARLEQSRRRAIAAATTPGSSRTDWSVRAGWRWASAGALAAGVLAAALLLRGPGMADRDAAPVAANPATLVQEPIEILAAGDEYEIATADEELEFYEWVEQATTSNGGNGQS